jgi:hypothetical protein
MRAALIYQHATTDRDRAVADALNTLVKANCAAEETAEADGDDDGASGALVPVA